MEENIEKIFRKVVEWEDNKIVRDDMSPDNVEEWDSLATMMFTMEIGKEFNIVFSYDEILAMNTIGDVKKIVAKKIKGK